MKRVSAGIAGLLVVALASAYFLGPMLHGQINKNVPIPKELTSYRHVVKRVAPAVVSIEARAKTVAVKRKGVVPQQLPFDEQQIPEEFRDFFKKFGEAPFREMPTPNPTPQRGFGSGFLIDADGIVVTNNHVVAGADSVVVTLDDGRKFTSKDIRGDARTDLAVILLDVDGEQLPYLQMGDSNEMEVGDRVLAFGAPFGLTKSVTQGIVSGKGRRGLRMNMYEDFIQTDAAINPGNSGGPLVSLDGRVIGINAAIKTRNGGFQGVGLAVGSKLAKDVIHALVKHGAVRRGYLGVEVHNVKPEIGKRLGLPNDTGVVVSRVFENSPAAEAGILAGDLIVSVNNEDVADSTQLQRIVAKLPLDEKTPFSVLRDGKKKVVKVHIKQQPKQFGLVDNFPVVPSPREEKTVNKIGVHVTELTAELAEQYGYDSNTTGVVIDRVSVGSVAWQAGLREGMLITKIDNKEVNDAESVTQILSEASLEKGVLFQVRSASQGASYILLQSNNS